jgi:hypothetical protein
LFVLAYRLGHVDGGEICGFYPLGTGTPQQLGSAITYARRYCLCAVTGVAPGGEDDDGAQAERADGLPVNKDGSLSRSRTTDEEKAAAGVMTSGQHAEHTQLAKLARSAPAERMTGLICQNTSHDRYGIEGCTECDPWLDQPAGLSVVGDPEDRPGSIGRDQQREMHALFGQLGVKDRTVRLATCAEVLDLPGLKSSSDLSYRQAGDLLLALREQARAEAKA